MKIVPMLVLLFACLAGCRAAGPCSYDVSADGWERTNIRPEGLPIDEHDDSGWFTNSDGAILICPHLESSDVCGGIRLVYKKTEESYALDQEIVCTS